LWKSLLCRRWVWRALPDHTCCLRGDNRVGENRPTPLYRQIQTKSTADKEAMMRKEQFKANFPFVNWNEVSNEILLKSVTNTVFLEV
jgi:hypothetical protein